VSETSGSLRKQSTTLEHVCNERDRLGSISRWVKTASYNLRSHERVHPLEILCSQKYKWGSTLSLDPAIEVDKFVVFKTARSGSEWLVRKYLCDAV
jgi:hypothetical protein